MKRTLLLTGVLMAMSCSMAHAVGLNLGWTTSAKNDCPSSALSSLDRTTACNSNSGVNVLIGSIIAPSGLNMVVGGAIILDLQTYAPTLPDWWRFDPVGCRNGAEALNMSFDSALDDGICHNAWQLNAASAFSYQPDYPGPGYGHLTMVGAIAGQNAQTWPLGTEWYVFRFTFSNTKTTGVGACAGCSTTALITFSYAEINNAAGTGTDATIITADPNGRQIVTWQNGGVVPTHRASWGQVKSLYR